MNVYNIIFIIFLIYYSFYFKSLFNKNMRKGIQQVNIKLDEMRTNSIKTLEQQKEFLNLKFPKKTEKWKFTWKKFGIFLVYFFISVLLFRVYSFLLYLINFNINLWQIILIILIGPITINYILSKFHLEQDNTLSNMFR